MGWESSIGYHSMVSYIEDESALINKANLRDLIAATGLVILLKLDLNRRFFSPCDLEIWWMTSKNYRAPLLHYIKLCALYQTPPWILCASSHLNPSVNSNWNYCPETLNTGQNRRFPLPYDLEIWWMTLKNNRAPLLCYIKLCASFQSHRWIPNGVRVRKRSIWVKIGDFFYPVWPWNLMDDIEKQ